MSRSVTPNFLIVGSAKCGTTSLYSWLKQHPDVFFPEIKEPSFFVRHYGINDWDWYMSLFAAGEGRKIIGDASTSYLTSPESPQWIKAELGPDVKILILVRNPVERAFSLYKWMVMEGYENAFPFEKALEFEDGRFSDEGFRVHNPEFFWDYMYVRSSQYCQNIETYMQLFGKDAIRIHLFDDIVANPRAIYDSVCEFLGISAAFSPNLTRENRGVVPRNVAFQHWLRVNAYRFSKTPLVRNLWTAAAFKSMWLNKAFGSNPPLPQSTRQRLTIAFENDVARLGVLLGRDLSHWFAPSRGG